MLGQALDGRYQLLRILGEGGMGVVYEAYHAITGRRVAVKLLNASAAQNGEAFSRFHREARVAGAIDTPHIAAVLDAGRDPATGSPFMVMELLSGEDVGQTTARFGALSPNLALRIAAQACVGLCKAHEAGVVHRDIKPANLFLARREGGEVVVKILDFGIAKLLPGDLGASAHAQETRTGSIMGTPQYMAPEQAKGLKAIDCRADIWSMGAVLYRLLTGRTPHADVDTLGQLVVSICTEEPRPVQDFAPWVPAEVAAIAHGALRIDPNQRFASAAAMLNAIRRLLPGGAWNIHESMIAPLSPAERAVAAPMPAASPEARTKAGSSAKGAVIAISAIAAAALLGGGALFVRAVMGTDGPPQSLASVDAPTLKIEAEAPARSSAEPIIVAPAAAEPSIAPQVSSGPARTQTNPPSGGARPAGANTSQKKPIAKPPQGGSVWDRE